MTLIVIALVTLLSIGCWSLHSLAWSIVLPVVVGFAWVFFETMAITAVLHRVMTHGAWRIKRKWYLHFWLWWIRAGGVRFWEWVQNHAWHHYAVDTPRDSYTPNAYMELTKMSPLRPPRPWRFLDNAKAYRRFSEYYAEHPEIEAELLTDPAGAAALNYLESLWAEREVYGRITTAQFINVLAFAIAAVPLAFKLGVAWPLAVLFVIGEAWATEGLKVYLYLLGGYFVNYFGHLAFQGQKDKPHQSNIPWPLMILTFFMFGEGWHWMHHTAPRSARFDRLDPGWWTIWLSCVLGLGDQIKIAVPIGVPGVFALMDYKPRLVFAA